MTGWARDTVGPVGETVAARDRVPEKPPRLVSVTLDVPDAPAEMATGAGFPTLIAKSVTLTEIGVEWDKEPPATFTVTV